MYLIHSYSYGDTAERLRGPWESRFFNPLAFSGLPIFFHTKDWIPPKRIDTFHQQIWAYCGTLSIREYLSFSFTSSSSNTIFYI